MAETPRLGGRVRLLRRREGLTQARLAERLGISTSYLNLIENNRRPLSAPLLIKLAQLFQFDLKSFATEGHSQLVSHLLEAFGDPLFDNFELSGAQVRELAAASPDVCRAVLSLYEAYRSSRESAGQWTSDNQEDSPQSLDASRLPTEDVSDLIQRHMNYFPELEEAAEKLRRDSLLDRGDLFENLAAFLKDSHGVKVRIEKVSAMGGAVRRFEPSRRVLSLSEILRRGSRNFQLAHQVCLLQRYEVMDRIAADPGLSSGESRALCRVALANYFAGALLMPYMPFLESARAERYDIELLGHRFRCGFEQISQRLTSLRRTGAEGVPFHMIRIDIAGNISKRFSASGMRFARFSAACPLWTVHSAFLTPGMTRDQLSRMPDGTTYFEVARTLRKETGGYHASRPLQALAIGCEVQYAKELVYSDGIDLESLEAAVPVGVTCRLCERTDCDQRAFPRLQHPLRVNPNVRARSFYAPVD